MGGILNYCIDNSVVSASTKMGLAQSEGHVREFILTSLPKLATVHQHECAKGTGIN